MASPEIFESDIEHIATGSHEESDTISYAEKHVFGNKNTLEVDTDDWQRTDGNSVKRIFEVLSWPLRGILNTEVSAHKFENAHAIFAKYPTRAFTSYSAETRHSINSLKPLEKIGNVHVRRIRLYRPQSPQTVDPTHDKLFSQLQHDETIHFLQPAVVYTLPLEILKIGHRKLDALDTIQAVVVMTACYTLKATVNDGLEPRLRTSLQVALNKNDNAIRSLLNGQEQNRLQAIAREAWSMQHPYEGGAPGQNN